MTSAKYIGMDVHKESISMTVRNAAGKIVMECVIETKASMILQFFDGLRRDLQVTFEEGTWAAWLYQRCRATEHMGWKIRTVPAQTHGLRSKKKSSRWHRVSS
jgi:hypothetical protein